MKMYRIEHRESNSKLIRQPESNLNKQKSNQDDFYCEYEPKLNLNDHLFNKLNHPLHRIKKCSGNNINDLKNELNSNLNSDLNIDFKSALKNDLDNDVNKLKLNQLNIKECINHKRNDNLSSNSVNKFKSHKYDPLNNPYLYLTKSLCKSFSFLMHKSINLKWSTTLLLIYIVFNALVNTIDAVSVVKIGKFSVLIFSYHLLFRTFFRE